MYIETINLQIQIIYKESLILLIENTFNQNPTYKEAANTIPLFNVLLDSSNLSSNS